MNPVKFKTVFVKMTKDPSKHAKELEDKLNELQQAGWDITRFDHDMAKGTLIVARRVDPRFAAAQMPHPLAVLLDLVPPGVEEPEGMSKTSHEVIHQVFSKLREAPRGIEEEVAIRRAVEIVCRKFPSPILRTAVTELRASIDHHRQHEHTGPEDTCPHSEQLERIVAALEKQVAQSVV